MIFVVGLLALASCLLIVLGSVLVAGEEQGWWDE